MSLPRDRSPRSVARRAGTRVAETGRRIRADAAPEDGVRSVLERELAVAIISYNGRRLLEETLSTLRSCFQGPVVLVDDGSDDGTPEWVEQRFPEVRLVALGSHTGRINLLRNRALGACSTRYVFLMDDDIRLAPECLPTLVRAIRSGEGILCCTPRLLDATCPNVLYHDGGSLHFLGVSGASRRGEIVPEGTTEPPAPTFGCGIMLIDRLRALDLGGFDEGYRLGWGDDGEFHLRGRIRGYRVLQVSDAVAYHVPRRHGLRRASGQFYNRLRLILTAYSGRTLLLLAPALLCLEALLAAGSLAGGLSRAYGEALRDVWRGRREILLRRREIQRSRRVEDRELLVSGGVQLPPALGKSGLVRRAARILELGMGAYFALVSRWL